ncbi:MAG TPA: M1 family aminopeptidase, partial [Longimicrobiales bacterium]
VGPDDQRPGEMTQQVPGAHLTWHFRAHDVRDFAFATSSRYLWDATHVTADPDRDGRPEAVRISALYRPEARSWRQAAVYTRHAVAFHSTHLLPYIYPQMTSAEGPEQGMEYPMLVFVSNYSQPAELLSVITHETGHQWFPMMVGSNEHEHAWQDEGLNTYIEDLATLDFSPGADVWGENLMAYLGIAGSDGEVPMMRPADLYGDERAYGVASYMKPALVLRALGTVLGPQRVQEGLRRYAAAWLLKHPQALDFFDSMNTSAGQDLGWFWYPWFFTSEVLDQAVAGVEQSPATGGTAGQRVAITIDEVGKVPMPVPLRLTLADGRTQDVTVPVGVWLGGARRYTEIVIAPAAVQRVVIDPDHLLPDVDRRNNEWPRQ